MAYFKIGNTDYSPYVSSLKISNKQQFNSGTNAAGNTVVDAINAKRTIEVEIISLDQNTMATLATAIKTLSQTIYYLDPETKALSSAVNCVLSSYDIEYYTIQSNKVSYKKFKLKFEEL